MQAISNWRKLYLENFGSKGRVINFAPGPAMLPEVVLNSITEEFKIIFNGKSIIEISHRSEDFDKILQGAKKSFRRLTGLPDNYQILFIHGGARTQFDALAMNLIKGATEENPAQYVNTGNFAKIAFEESQKHGPSKIVATSLDKNHTYIPRVEEFFLSRDAPYMHVTSNNTIYGTRWNDFPIHKKAPLVVDKTSDILSRVIDYSQFGMVYAGLQKNLGAAGVAIVVIRDDLLGKELPYTMSTVNYGLQAKKDSCLNTANTFSIFTAYQVLSWLETAGGVSEIEEVNRKKAAILYDAIDISEYYVNPVRVEDRSIMNVPFTLPNEELTKKFLAEAKESGLDGLKGHRNVGGARASIYNAMPCVGVECLIGFMKDFRDNNPV